jgi:ferredoxin-NADP reductase
MRIDLHELKIHKIDQLNKIPVSEFTFEDDKTTRIWHVRYGQHYPCGSKGKKLTVSVTLASAPARTKHLRMSVEPSVAAIIKGVSLPIPSTSAPA